MENIGERLKLERILKGLSQGGVAQRANIAQTVLCGIERGRRKPSPKMVERIQAAILALAKEHE